MARSYIPNTARVIGKLELQTPDGRIGRVYAFEGEASKGYRSGYEKVEAYWVRMESANGFHSQNSLTPAKFRTHLAATVKDLANLPVSEGKVITRTGCYAP